jgi:hypothetical protein
LDGRAGAGAAETALLAPARPRLLAHDGIVAQHFRDGGVLREQRQLVHRLRLGLRAVLDTGGQTATSGSEPPVAQAASKLVAIARPASRGLQHPAMNRIGFLHGFETLRHAPGTFAVRA